MIKTKINKK